MTVRSAEPSCLKDINFKFIKKNRRLAKKKIKIFIFILFSLPVLTLGQETSARTLDQTIKQLDFKDTDIKDVVRSIATKYGINIFIENKINKRITLHLENVTVESMINFLAEENGLILQRTGNIYKLISPSPPPKMEKPINLSIKNGKISADLQNDDLDKVVRAIIRSSSYNILIARGTSGYVSGVLNRIDFEEGFTELLRSNGFILKKNNNIFIIEKDFSSGLNSNKKGRHSSFFLNIGPDSLLSFDLQNVPIKQVIEEAASKVGENIFIYGNVEGSISARTDRVTFHKLLELLFQGTEYTYRLNNNITLIGSIKDKGMASSKLIMLSYIKADKLIDLLPGSLTAQTELKPIIEQNGIMVIGSKSTILDIEEYIRAIDRPSPQILIETLVLDINNTKAREISINAQRGRNTNSPQDSTGLNLTSLLLPGLDMILNADYLNKQLNGLGKVFGITNIGRLPADFDIRLKALETNGIVQIRSRPQISTLNGYPADISVGETQYYKLTTKTPLRDPNQIYVSEYERFETIEANISLEILPWVSSSGEITVEIHPKFQIPGERVSIDIPPTIQTRELNSTVRLRDGETIILGGLIQTTTSKSTSGIPFLSSLPLIGNLFKNQSNIRSKNELIIYVTPHLYYGDDE